MAGGSAKPEHCLHALSAMDSDMTQHQAPMLTLQQRHGEQTACNSTWNLPMKQYMFVRISNQAVRVIPSLSPPRHFHADVQCAGRQMLSQQRFLARQLAQPLGCHSMSN